MHDRRDRGSVLPYHTSLRPATLHKRKTWKSSFYTKVFILRKQFICIFFIRVWMNDRLIRASSVYWYRNWSSRSCSSLINSTTMRRTSLLFWRARNSERVNFQWVSQFQGSFSSTPSIWHQIPPNLIYNSAFWVCLKLSSLARAKFRLNERRRVIMNHSKSILNWLILGWLLDNQMLSSLKLTKIWLWRKSRVLWNKLQKALILVTRMVNGSKGWWCYWNDDDWKTNDGNIKG